VNKKFSRLLGDRTKYEGASYVCNSCLNVFTASIGFSCPSLHGTCTSASPVSSRGRGQIKIQRPRQTIPCKVLFGLRLWKFSGAVGRAIRPRRKDPHYRRASNKRLLLLQSHRLAPVPNPSKSIQRTWRDDSFLRARHDGKRNCHVLSYR